MSDQAWAERAVRADQAREGAEDRGRERRLTRGGGGRPPRGRPPRSFPASLTAYGQSAYQPSTRGVVDLGMELDAPCEAADAEALRAAAFGAL